MRKKSRPVTVRSIIGELKSGTFVANAQQRSTRRKSPWNLLLLFAFPMWLALWWVGVELAWLLHLSFFENHAASMNHYWMRGMGHLMTIPRFLILFPPMLPALSGAMVIVNFLVYQIPTARNAMDREDQQYPGTEYSAGQPVLIRITAFLAAGAAVLCLIGAALDVRGR